MPAKRPYIGRPLYWYIATWFGCGLAPKASGTVGSLGALPFAYAIHMLGGNAALFLASLIIFLIGCWASSQYLKANGGEDPKEIVVDEVAGQWLLLSVLFPTWSSYLVGFIVFRLFDVVKPWPVSWADNHIKGGFGVMVDDMLAAVFPIVVFLIIMIESHVFGSGKILQPVMNFLGGSYVQ